MIDIHAHVLPGVDDGSSSLKSSLKMINESYQQGVTDIICTPHYRDQYKKPVEELQSALDELKACLDIPVNLCLGQEFFIGRNYKKYLLEKKAISMNGTDFLLVEFPFNDEIDIADVIYELKTLSYKPIVAHIERYSYANLSVAEEVKSLGGLIQVNADSIVGKNKRHYKKFIKQLFANDLVDFVASDIHDQRINYMQKAREVVAKKYGEAVAERIFELNAKKIIKGQAIA
jgi:protein-tyrosine phosphatase